MNDLFSVFEQRKRDVMDDVIHSILPWKSSMCFSLSPKSLIIQAFHDLLHLSLTYTAAGRYCT